MQIIPVLDVKNGLVVRGVMGDRANYRPIETPLAPSADPVAVTKGLMTLADFSKVYIADLDAIEGGARNEQVIEALADAFPAMRFWVDAGVRSRAEAEAVRAMPGCVAVLGSESVTDAEVVAAFSGESDVVLSLDFRGETFLGPAELLSDASLWPSRVIAMTLAKVGSSAGPDLGRLRGIKTLAGDRAVFAAGGVRGPQDVAALSEAGIAGALVATALHDGRLTKDFLRSLEG
ncbi:HisA/HisF-related TIM barrel protein [Aurantimonas sp. VKM B-3413]|uniref:HisA/HisF-related TIM barrel protein n=1 Tax=Aurantimonas sp. VKM B-3413 TaxID=2779401 RepID=UPI001E643549|nr:HisA/HisF-related TIM barrel protein [Aurantimonas sp. VKM B-3413]MCB8838230.1 nickel transporter [Aurantimonas sp. VKM B-3413]